jgi:hypothetical protein
MFRVVLFRELTRMKPIAHFSIPAVFALFSLAIVGCAPKQAPEPTPAPKALIEDPAHPGHVDEGGVTRGQSDGEAVDPGEYETVTTAEDEYGPRDGDNYYDDDDYGYEPPVTEQPVELEEEEQLPRGEEDSESDDGFHETVEEEEYDGEW